MLTQEIVKELFDYHPQTGNLTWKHRDRKWFKTDKQYNAWNTRYSNVIAGHKHLKCMGIKILSKQYLCHRIIWLYLYGSWPKNQIDHINGNPYDNRINNLRECTNQENSQNKKNYKTNKTGFLGVRKYKNKFRAEITINAKSIYLGVYNTPEEAYEKYLMAKEKYHIFNPVPRENSSQRIGLDNHAQVG